MQKIMRLFGLCLVVMVLSACTKDKVELQDKIDYSDYSPGYTGYTVGYDGYGNYNDGYGPSFWNPRYYFYTGYNQGFGRGQKLP